VFLTNKSNGTKEAERFLLAMKLYPQELSEQTEENINRFLKTLHYAASLE